MAQLRKIEAGEEAAFVRSVLVPFLEPPNGDEETEHIVDYECRQLEPARTWVAEVPGRFVGNCCTYSMDLTVPSAPGQECPVIPMAGVSSVGVHPTHRRRGLLRQMMALMLADARERGEAIAGLVASESVIYGRYGYGHATDRLDLVIDSKASEFVGDVPSLDLQLVSREEALKLEPAIFERQRRRRAGEPNRTEPYWEEHLADRATRRGGGKGLFHAVCDGGYVAYRAFDGDPLHIELHRVVIEELRGITPEIEAGLWRFVFDLDLVGQVRAKRRPVDDPVRWRLADRRQLQVENFTDFLHLRVLDVAAALHARGYRARGRLVLDLLPPLVDEGPADPAVGRWVLDAGPGGAECRPARPEEGTDLRMEVTDLGSLYLGGFKASVLAAAGRIEELTAGSLDTADNLFATPLAPLSSTGF